MIRKTQESPWLRAALVAVLCLPAMTLFGLPEDATGSVMSAGERQGW